MGRHGGWMPRISRTTRLVFLLDPGASTVWPHPRRETYANVGVMLGRWILRMRNPHLAIREPPLRGFRNVTESELAAFDAERHWRWDMLMAYGDKWPND